MNQLKRTIVVAIASTACLLSAAQAQNPREAKASLTLEQARERATRISELHYSLAFELDGESSAFSGDVTTTFTLDDDTDTAQRELTIDFTGGTVANVNVNGSAVDVNYNGFFLILPGTTLRRGTNTIEIAFSHPYSNDGAGLYRFRDPEDGRYYLYTDFEPYDQNRLFPSFDQPDLKARYTTKVTAPPDWQVISIVAESEVAENGGKRVWTFPESLPVSTYIYALHAGEYHRWDASAGDLPLRLFARESLAAYVYPDHWFMPTQQGFEFYQQYFEMPYPFGKYDQIIVPHFNAGAMENVGAVTFSERYLSRGTVTRQNRRSIASVILHEMAHMWFGDVVTMDWWNGLWLNESFATFMATLAMVESTEFTDEWQSSYHRTIRAYQADERETTHPIELAIPDTDAAFANFDAITYEKGSAVLTQLNHLVGPEVFRRGVSRYLNEHAFGNTAIDDFLGAISTEAGQSLQSWARDWLNEPGTNGIRVAYSCHDNAIESMSITQDAPASWPVLRQHRTQLGLYRLDGSSALVSTLPVTYAGEQSNVSDAVGLPCPDLVYANHGDWDYARVRLNASSIESLKSSLNAFDDPLTRSMLWQSVYDLMLDAELTPTEFIDFALANIAAEPVDEVTSQVLSSISSALSYWVRSGERAAELGATASQIEDFLWQQMLASEVGSDRQLMFFDRYRADVSSTAGLERLAALLTADETALPAGLTMDQDRRWAILMRLSEFGEPNIDQMLTLERDRDPSDEGRLSALSVLAAAPDPIRQHETMEQLLDPDPALAVSDARAIASGLFPDHQQELQLEVASAVLNEIQHISDEVDPLYFRGITGGLLGTICDETYLDRLNETIRRANALHPSLRKSLLNMRFDIVRCLAIAETMADSASTD